MKMVTTRWRPDTCGCVINYQWDKDLALADRVITLKDIEQKCAAHSSKNDTDCYTAVKDENTRKNIAEKIILENYDSVRKSIKDDNNNHVRYGWKDTASFSWSFDASRELQITLNELTTNDKTDYQTKLDAQFGIKKAKIN